MDRTYGGRHVSGSEAGTQAAAEIARREAAEQARQQREMAEASERIRRSQEEADRSRREAEQRRRTEQVRSQQAKQQKARQPAPAKQNGKKVAPARAPSNASSSGSVLRSIITVVAVLGAGGWALSVADGDGRLITAGLVAIIAGALAWALYKVIIALVVLAIAAFIALVIIGQMGDQTEVSAAKPGLHVVHVSSDVG